MLQIAFEAVSWNERKVLLLDADKVKSNLSRICITTRDNIFRSDRINFEGFLFDAANKLCRGEADAVVIDSAAGSEEYFHRHLPEIAVDVRQAGGRLIVIQPVTNNPMNQDNIVNFGRMTMTKDMGVLMVRNFGQGRTEQDYAVRISSPERQEILDRGMGKVQH